LGGGGPVGIATLHLIKELGWTACVVDPRRPPHPDYHDRRLAGTLADWTKKKYTLGDLRKRLAGEAFDLVIDLTPTLDKRQSIRICDERGVPLVNSTMVDYKDDIHIAAFNFLSDRPAAARCGHVVASGMNPGAVNAMAEEIIAAYDQPDAIVYWEYDDTLPCDGVLAGPSTTWSQGEAGDEMTEDWTFEVVEEGTVVIHEDALSWRPQSFETCGVPGAHLGIPPRTDAMLIGHEECIYMGWRHDTAAKFVYGFHPENMKLIRQAGYGWRPHLLLQDDRRPLAGRDRVGVACHYIDDDSWVGAYCDLANTADVPLDTNATCILVAAGVVASAVLQMEGKVAPGVHLTHELPGWLEAFRRFAVVQPYQLEGDSLRLTHSRRAVP
jgi:homospermidine synthase